MGTPDRPHSPARIDARHNLCGRQHPAARPQGAGDPRLSLSRRGRALPRTRLAATLWDRVPDFQARASFRQAFRELIVALGPLADELIPSDRETVSLNTDLCWVDALAVLAPDLPRRIRIAADLATLCSGELLEGLDNLSVSFDQWLIGERTRFTERLRALLEAELRQAHRSNPDASERADIARRLIMFDPTHEGASRILMRALADMGERAQALREYARCREALKRALDVEPSRRNPRAVRSDRACSAREERGEKDKREPDTPLRAQKRPKAPVSRRRSRTRLRVGVLPFLAHTLDRRRQPGVFARARRSPRRSRASAGST